MASRVSAPPNARAPFSRISEVLGVSDQTVARRYTRLRSSGALRVRGLTNPYGFAVPLIGIAAAAGLVVFFLCAVGAHLRARYYRLGYVAMFLSLAVATLTVTLAAWEP
ncbi:AsnC family protein [Nonomuraea diastatica]|uniref:AsnC family protein n=1 Tax=Nonomuraea diastatica TaxID=1848329 RepID=UPI001C6FD653|nr:AsnC family protein [Nonomuraea diastatica]